MQIKTFAEAQEFLYGLPKSTGVTFRGGYGLARAKKFFDLLGNPQDAIPSIHIAGTSGKGSVAYVTSSLLEAAGKTVGLHVSPHVFDVRERVQVNNKLIDESEFCELLQSIMTHIETMKNTETGGPSYFEVMTGMAFLAFAKHNVDYAVIETGLGGTYDATNLISRPDKLAVITQIGLDHTAILGNTITEIAAQKAGIIQPGNQSLVLSQQSAVLEVFKKRAGHVGAELEIFVPGKHVQHAHPTTSGTEFNLKLKPWIWRDLTTGLIGKHQAINTGLAIRVVQILSERDDFKLSESVARKSLASLRMPARFEIRMIKGKTIIIDGAHNPQKMQPIPGIIKELFPGKTVTVLVAMKEDKDEAATLATLKTVANSFVVTKFFGGASDLASMAEDPDKLVSSVHALGKEAIAVEDPHEALKVALTKTKDILLVTGSFYFIGELYQDLTKPAKL